MDLHAFDKIPCGLYIISAPGDAYGAGCVVNTFGQVTAEPICVTVSIHKGNCTTRAVQEAGVFACTALADSAPMELIGLFGFQSGKTVDKFAQLPDDAKGIDENGVPYVRANATARFACTVKQVMDMGTHLLFFAQVDSSETICDDATLTYGDYHFIKKGLTPPKAASYRAPEPVKKSGPAKTWRCNVCGYLYEGDALPEGFICPVCKVEDAVFEPVGAEPVASVKAWRCTVCGYVYESDVLPEDYICPVCKQDASVFEPVLGEAEKTPKAWRCAVCGYVYEGEVLPEDYVCPICKQDASVFEPVF